MGQYLDALVRSATEAFEKRKNDFILTDSYGRWNDRIYDLRQAASDAVTGFIDRIKQSERAEYVAILFRELRNEHLPENEEVTSLLEAKTMSNKVRLAVAAVVAKMKQDDRLVEAEQLRAATLMELARDHEYINDGSNPTELLREYFASHPQSARQNP